MLYRWVANLSAFVITAVLGEWLCLQREMRDIPIGEPRMLLLALLAIMYVALLTITCWHRFDGQEAVRDLNGDAAIE